MTVGAGFALDAIRRHKAYMRNTRRFTKTRVSGHIRSQGPTHEPFACQHLCPECGLLSDAPEPDGCPSCAAIGTIDLGHIATAEALREVEERRRNEGPRAGRVLRDAATIGLFMALSVAGFHHLIHINMRETLPYFVVLGIAALACTMLRAGLKRWPSLLARSRRAATRWRRPLPPHAVAEGAHTGTPHSGGSPLRSPLSDTPCLAWRVRATVRTSSGRHLMIDDTRSVAFALSGIELGQNAVAIDAPPSDTRRLSDCKVGAEARGRLFLRERGCFTHEGSWSLVEQVIPIDAPVQLSSSGGGAPVLRPTAR